MPIQTQIRWQHPWYSDKVRNIPTYCIDILMYSSICTITDFSCNARWWSCFRYRHTSLRALSWFLWQPSLLLRKLRDHGQNLCHQFNTKSPPFASISSYSLDLWHAIVPQLSSPTGTFTKYTCENRNAPRQNTRSRKTKHLIIVPSGSFICHIFRKYSAGFPVNQKFNNAEVIG